ncbi:MAG: hypothetical protein GC181_12375 [Bacteroidetes bacterium]|nr:hypothetical protein [Bacteroidota bacterium]
MNRIYYTFIWLLLIGHSHFSLAQNSCEEALYSARRLFESGDIKSTIDTLESCADALHSKADRVQAYRLLAQAWLELNETEKAETYAEKLLKTRHDYQRFPNIDPMNFTRLLDKYVVTTPLYLSSQIGATISVPVVVKNFPAYSSTQRYKPVVGYTLGLNAEYVFPKNKIALHFGVKTFGLGIHHIIDSAVGWTQNYHEDMRYVAGNFGISKSFGFAGSWEVKPMVGLGFMRLVSSDVYFEAVNLETGSKQQYTSNVLSFRNRNIPSATISIQVEKTLKNGHLLGLSGGITQASKNTFESKDRLADLNFNLNNQYVNDDLKMRFWSLTLIYKWPIMWQVKKQE